MKIITLGACCKKSTQNHANTILAAKNCGIKEPVINISDMMEISKYGIMSLPAIIINNKIVSIGRLLTVEQIEQLINAQK